MASERKRQDAAPIGGSAGGVILGYKDHAPYLPPESDPTFPLVFPVVDTPLLLAATVLAVFAASWDA